MKGGEEVGLEVPFPAILPLLAKQPNAGCKAIGFYTRLLEIIAPVLWVWS